MYDVEVHVLKNCEGAEYTYYFNTFHGCERFCFKYDYICQYVYPTLNETAQFNIPTTISTTIPTTIPSTFP